jgi:hypothetical protein
MSIGDWLLEKGNQAFRWVLAYNLLVLLLQLGYQAPWIPTSPQCEAGDAVEELGGKCFSWMNFIGLRKFKSQIVSDCVNVKCISALSIDRGLGPSVVIFMCSILQMRVYGSSAYTYVKDFYFQEAHRSKARARERIRIITRTRVQEWMTSEAETRAARSRLHKLVERVDALSSQVWAGIPPPPKPSGIPIAKCISLTAVKVRWNKVLEGPVSGYVIQMKQPLATSLWQHVKTVQTLKPVVVVSYCVSMCTFAILYHEMHVLLLPDTGRFPSGTTVCVPRCRHE